MEDYKSAHLQWILQHKTFVPWGLTVVGQEYFDVISNLYHGKDMCEVSQEVAKSLFAGDRRHNDQTLALINATCSIKRFLWLTIGFNRDKYCDDKAMKFIYKVLNAKWSLQFNCVLEFHGSTGWRPHCHMLIEYPSKLYKSDIVNNIYKILQSKSFEGLVVGKNNIEFDVGNPDYHIKYLSGEKRDSKVDYVVEDRVYRTEHQIPHLFKK